MTQRILLLSDSHEHTMIFERSLCDGEFDIDSQAASNKVAMLVKKSRIDIVVFILTRSNANTINTIHQIMQEYPVPVVLFVKEGDEHSAAIATQTGVSAYVIDGLRVDRVKPILAAAVTRFKETQKLRQELNKTQTDLRERKLVERAKGLLTKHRGCSEDEAYTRLRTLAMKQNKRLGEIAEGVINTASLMD